MLVLVGTLLPTPLFASLGKDFDLFLGSALRPAAQALAILLLSLFTPLLVIRFLLPAGLHSLHDWLMRIRWMEMRDGRLVAESLRPIVCCGKRLEKVLVGEERLCREFYRRLSQLLEMTGRKKNCPWSYEKREQMFHELLGRFEIGFSVKQTMKIAEIYTLGFDRSSRRVTLHVPTEGMRMALDRLLHMLDLDRLEGEPAKSLLADFSPVVIESVEDRGGNKVKALIAVFSRENEPLVTATYLFGVQQTGHVWMTETFPRVPPTLTEHEAWALNLETNEVAFRLRET